jgi:hypothetical protein
MALLSDVDFAGLKLTKCYIRIENISGSKRNGWSGLAKIYATEAAAADLAKLEPIKEFSVNASYDETKPNPFEVLYEAVLKLDEYKKAVKV